jgi:hypothetical protein
MVGTAIIEVVKAESFLKFDWIGFFGDRYYGIPEELPKPSG